MAHITEAEVLERIEKLTGSRNLALKGSVSWKTADETQKAMAFRDALAMYNSGGGWLVFGAAEGQLTGLSAEEEASFESCDFNDRMKIFSQPEFKCEKVLMKVPFAGAEKQLCIISVPAGKGYPAVCANNAEGPGGVKILENGSVYIRREDGKSERVANFIQMKTLLDRAVSDRLHAEEEERDSEEKSLAEISDAEAFFNMHGAFDSWAFWEILCYPSVYKANRLSLQRANKLFEDAVGNRDGFWFFGPNKVEAVNRGAQFFTLTPETLECGRIYESGVFAWRKAVPEDYGTTKMQSEDGKKVMSIDSAMETITRAAMFAGIFYPLNGLDCDLNFHVYIRKTENRRLVSTTPGLAVPASASCKVESASVLKRFKLGEIDLVRKNSIDAGMDMASLFNWHDSEVVLPAVMKMADSVFKRYIKKFPSWLAGDGHGA
ncbi:MAG: RNA-binding domain-containing protein [Elusimicrobiaceae bacterium]